MAKRKHAAALFEVFNDNRGMNRPEKASGAGLSRWWFKSRQGGISSASAFDPNDPTTMPIKSPLIAPRIAAVEAMETPAAKSAATAGAAPQQARSAGDVHAMPTSFATPHRFHLDIDRREVVMRLPFTTVVVTCFGIMLSLALCYVIGRRVGAVAIPVATVASTPATDDAWSQPVRPAALDVPRRVATPTPTPKIPTAVAPTPNFGSTAVREHESAPMANTVKNLVPLPKPPVEDGPRIIGLNYWLVQTYPNQESATEARDFLRKSGVSCTVEKAPAGFAVDPSWFAVVSTKGFEHIHTTECENVGHQIEKASEKFAGNGKFKRFAPTLFKLK